MTTRFFSLAAVGLLLSASAVRADLSITNGDFENAVLTIDGNTRGTDVQDWFDFDSPSATVFAWWQQTSQDNNAATSPFPGDSTYLFMTGDTGGNPDRAVLAFAYQNIGTLAPGPQTKARISFDAATVQDQAGNNQHDIVFSIYQDDGSFAGAQNVDINGAAGVTLIGSASYLTLLRNGAASADNPEAGSVLIDLSSANTTNDLWLRIGQPNDVPGVPSWLALDNVTIAQVIPEPATVALVLAGIIGLGLSRRRR
jgi:hypothetical protein